jgi:hypothetical protein
VFLAVFAGAILIVDLRLMGRTLMGSAGVTGGQGCAAVADRGLPGCSSPASADDAERVAEHYSIFFWIKMVFMALALIFTFTLRRKVTLADRVGLPVTFQTKVVGLVSIALGHDWPSRPG